ncbi:MAG: hypothetical protein K6G10_02685 [Butyrivibrio sp.]|nr:hypothetical protein [Butyrivibrio sp.]
MAHKIFGDARIMEAYTLNSYFVTLAPWFEGDSMVVSFVKKGTQGKDNVTVYVALKTFEKLIDSIKDGSFLDAIKKDDKDDNPGAWVCRTGQNGSKMVAIGLGSKNSKTGKRSITIHGYDATKKLNANVPIRWEDLTDMVSAYELVVGPEPTDNVWHKMLHEAFWDAYESKKKHYEKSAEDEEQVTEAAAPSENEPAKQEAEKMMEATVTLSDYTKDGDVISFNGTLNGNSSVFRIASQEMAGKDKDAWTKASKDMKKGNIDLRLKLRMVKSGEYTILGIA